jgi:hypothetical protein
MKKKIFVFLILFIIFLVFGLLIYINNVFAPVTLKAKIISALKKSLNANVQIENIRYNLFEGLIIQNLAIYKETKDFPYITAKEISLNPLLLPLLQKKIIVPLVRVDSPKIYLELYENKTLNFAEPFAANPAVAKEKQEFSVTVSKISVSEGECYLKDKSVTPIFTRDMTAIKIGLELKLPQSIKFLLQAKITNPQSNPSFLSAEGEYNPGEKKLAAQIKLNSFLAKEYLTYLKKLPFLLSEGNIDADLKASVKEKLVNITGTISSKATVVRSEKFALSGDFTLKPQIEYGLEDKITKYKTTAQIAHGKLLGLKFTKEITEIQGDIQLNETAVRSTNLKAKILDSPVKIKGALENFAQPVIKLKISSQRVKLNNAVVLLPNPPKGLVVEGQARLLLDLDYDAKNPPLQIKGIAQIDAPKLKLAALNDPLENIRGAVVFSNRGLTWPSLYFTHKKIPYKTSGSLKDFQAAEINCELGSQELSLKSNLTLRDSLVTINSCAGKYRQSEFDIKGTADVKQSTLDLNGKLNLYLKNIFGLLSEKAREKLTKLKLDGACKIEGNVKGNVTAPKNLVANLKVASENFSVYDLKIKDARFNLKQSNAMLNVNEFSAKSYDGSINAQLNLNLNATSPVYNTKFALENIDLAKLKKDTNFKDKDLAGSLNIKGELQGLLQDINTLNGNGYLTVKDGKIWEINLFKGLGEFLFLPIYQKISFSEIDADFFIKDRKIEFANSFIGGEKMELATKGYIGFNGNINLDMHARISKSLLEDSPDLRKFGSLIFGNLLNIKIGGTLQKPQYNVVPIPKALLREIKRFFLKH